MTHAPTGYEFYILFERQRYGFETNEENDFPTWLKMEDEAYHWMISLNHKMYSTFQDHIVSKETLRRINHISTIRFLRYRDISPILKTALQAMITELVSLSHELSNDNMWKRPCLLSWPGFIRWKEATQKISELLYINPDPSWRENWEKTNCAPYCTRLEAQDLAFDYILQTYNIDLKDKAIDGLYYIRSTAKHGIFRMHYSRRIPSDDTLHNTGIIEVNMLSKTVRPL